MKKYLIVILSMLMMTLSMNNVNALSYKYKKIDYTYHYRGRTFTKYYRKVLVKGHSKRIKKIRAYLKKIDKRDQTKVNKSMSNAEFRQDSYDWWDKSNVRVTKNTKSIFSICRTNDSHFGGVANRDYYGYTFNKKGKLLKLFDVTKGKKACVLVSIKNALLKEEINGSSIRNYISHPNKIQFYVNGHKVYVCISSYEVNQGTRPIKFALKSKY